MNLSLLAALLFEAFLEQSHFSRLDVNVLLERLREGVTPDNVIYIKEHDRMCVFRKGYALKNYSYEIKYV